MPDNVTEIEENGKTWVTEASGIAIVLVWLAALVGIEMPATIAVTIVGLLIIGIRKLNKKGRI